MLVRSVAMLVLVLALAACEAPEVTTTADPNDDLADATTEPEPTATDEPAAEPTTDPEPEPADEPTDEPTDEDITAQVGDAITLRGNDADLQVIDPATGGEFMEATDGHRYVAVDVQLENVGGSPYSDSPDNGAQLIDVDNRQHNTTFAEVGECQTFGGSVTMPPGDTRAGCMIFEVPEGVELRSFQFTLDSGFAPQTGVWELGG